MYVWPDHFWHTPLLELEPRVCVCVYVCMYFWFDHFWHTPLLELGPLVHVYVCLYVCMLALGLPPSVCHDLSLDMCDIFT
jgi:hypothetical protein